MKPAFEKGYTLNFAPCSANIVEQVKTLFFESVETKENLYFDITFSNSKRLGNISVQLPNTTIFNKTHFLSGLSKLISINEIIEWEGSTHLSSIFCTKKLEDKEFVKMLRDVYVPDAEIETILAEEADDENFYEGWNTFYEFQIPTKTILIKTNKNYTLLDSDSWNDLDELPEGGRRIDVKLLAGHNLNVFFTEGKFTNKKGEEIPNVIGWRYHEN